MWLFQDDEWHVLWEENTGWWIIPVDDFSLYFWYMFIASINNLANMVIDCEHELPDGEKCPCVTLLLLHILSEVGLEK